MPDKRFLLASLALFVAACAAPTSNGEEVAQQEAKLLLTLDAGNNRKVMFYSHPESSIIVEQAPRGSSLPLAERGLVNPTFSKAFAALRPNEPVPAVLMEAEARISTADEVLEPTSDGRVSNITNPSVQGVADPNTQDVAVSTEALTTDDFLAFTHGCSVPVPAVLSFCRLNFRTPGTFTAQAKADNARYVVNSHQGNVGAFVTLSVSGQRVLSQDIPINQMFAFSQVGPHDVFGATLARTFGITIDAPGNAPGIESSADATGFWFNID